MSASRGSTSNKHGAPLNNSGAGNYVAVGADDSPTQNVKREFDRMHGARPDASKDTSHINFGFLSALLAVQCLGVLLFGLGISSWNVQGNVYPKIQDEVTDTSNIKFKLIQWMLTIGMVVGAFLAGPMSSLGRRTPILIMCLVGIVGNSATFFYDTYWLLVAGKFLAGLSAGGINCFCPKYINEISPQEVSGSTGALF